MGPDAAPLPRGTVGPVYTLTVAVLVGALALLTGPELAGAAAAVTQPPRPKSGPGGTDYPHRGWRVSSAGAARTRGTCSSPSGRGRAKAPLAIVMHGYYEFSGYDQMYELIRHTVRKGSIVIYPRWQTDVAIPVPGPVRHRAVHDLGRERHPRCRLRTCGRTRSAGAAQARQGELLRLLLRRHHHGEPREPVQVAATCRSRGRSSSTTHTTAA